MFPLKNDKTKAVLKRLQCLSNQKNKSPKFKQTQIKAHNKYQFNFRSTPNNCNLSSNPNGSVKLIQVEFRDNHRCESGWKRRSVKRLARESWQMNGEKGEQTSRLASNNRKHKKAHGNGRFKTCACLSIDRNEFLSSTSKQVEAGEFLIRHCP